METGKGIGIILNNKRINQLIYMFSYITDKSMDESREIILDTDTGRAIHDNNTAVMYEQQTENLYSIAMELRENKSLCELTERFTTEAIAKSMQELREIEKQKSETPIPIVTIFGNRELIQKNKQRMKKNRKQALQVKKQNLNNVRRIENVNKLKG